MFYKLFICVSIHTLDCVQYIVLLYLGVERHNETIINNIRDFVLLLVVYHSVFSTHFRFKCISASVFKFLLLFHFQVSEILV